MKSLNIILSVHVIVSIVILHHCMLIIIITHDCVQYYTIDNSLLFNYMAFLLHQVIVCNVLRLIYWYYCSWIPQWYCKYIFIFGFCLHKGLISLVASNSNSLSTIWYWLLCGCLQNTMSDCNKFLCEHVVLPIFFFILTDERNLSKLPQIYLTFNWLSG